MTNSDPTSIEEIIAALNALTADDKERDHGVADDLLMFALDLAGHSAVVDAYRAARDRAGGWWYA